MSKLLNSARELQDFAARKNTKPLTLWVPNDACNDLEQRVVANIDEYHRICREASIRSMQRARQHHSPS